ncbi:uncharacterized protein ISCGN_016737 [Ixodes scapularis]
MAAMPQEQHAAVGRSLRNYKCKHIVAVLLHINAARTFEQLSPTDQPQKWGKVQKERVMEKYEPRMMVDLPCAKKVKTKETPQLQGHVLERLLKDVGHRSAAKMHFEAAVEAAVEATMDFDTTSEPGPRDLTLMGSLDELSKLAGSSGKRLQLQDVLQHLHESKSAKDVKEIQFSTREQQKSNLWMRHRVLLCCLFAYVAAGVVEEYPPQPYSFAYDNTDEFGTRIAHEENADANNARVGSYSYSDASGITRTVRYTADASGFHATVETNEPGTKSSAPADVEYASSAVEGPAPVAVKAPVAVHAAPVTVHAVHAAPVVHAVHAAPVVHAVHASPVAFHAAPVSYALSHAPLTYTLGRAKSA